MFGHPAIVLDVHRLLVDVDQVEHRRAAAPLAVAVGARGAHRQRALDLAGALVVVESSDDRAERGIPHRAMPCLRWA